MYWQPSTREPFWLFYTSNFAFLRLAIYTVNEGGSEEVVRRVEMLVQLVVMGETFL